MCEIGLDERTKFRGNRRALSEPQFESAHRLMQEHAEAIGSPQSAGAGLCQQRRLQRHIDEIGNNGILRQQANIDFKCWLAVHAERCRIHQQPGARQ